MFRAIPLLLLTLFLTFGFSPSQVNAAVTAVDADVTLDGRVTPVDAIYVANRIDTDITPTTARADADRNGLIDVADLQDVVNLIGTVNELPVAQKTQVNFEFVRINYLIDDQPAREAEVGLEICAELDNFTPLNCEPVLRVLNTSDGAIVPPLRQENRLNVYIFPYGYSVNRTIVGNTLVSEDIFVTPPELPR